LWVVWHCHILRLDPLGHIFLRWQFSNAPRTLAINLCIFMPRRLLKKTKTFPRDVVNRNVSEHPGKGLCLAVNPGFYDLLKGLGNRNGGSLKRAWATPWSRDFIRNSLVPHHLERPGCQNSCQSITHKWHKVHK